MNGYSFPTSRERVRECVRPAHLLRLELLELELELELELLS